MATFKRLAIVTASLVAAPGVWAQPAPSQEPPAIPPGPESDPIGTFVEAPPETTPAPETMQTTAAATETAPDAKADNALEVRYDKGILFDGGDRFEAKLALRTQFRAEFTRETEDGAEFESALYIPRARLQLEGHVHSPGTRYKLEMGLGDRGSFGFVRDLYVDQKVGESFVRVGQWKRPFNRQELVSDFASDFNERAITAEFVGGGRDVGVAWHNNYEKSPDGVEWVVGVFDRFAGGSDRPRITTTCSLDPLTSELTCANGAATTQPSDWGPAVVARVGYNKGGLKGYSEGDLEGGGLRWGVAANYKVDLANLEGGDAMSHAFGVDAMIKNNGLDVLLGAYGVKLGDADVLFGAVAQAGYMLTPKKLQLAGRFAFAQDSSDSMLIEARAALTLYAQGHAWKLVNDVGMLQLTGVDDKPRLEARSMAQLTF